MALRRAGSFLHVVEAGGITAAAQSLNVSKSVISKRIGEFEDALGAELFRRSTRRVVPNGGGKDLYERMRALVQELDETIGQVSTRTGELRGRLRVAAPMTLGTRYRGPVLPRSRPTTWPSISKARVLDPSRTAQRSDPPRAPPGFELDRPQVLPDRPVLCCSSG